MESEKFKNVQKVYPNQTGLSRGLKGSGVTEWPMQGLCDVKSDIGQKNPLGILTSCRSQGALGVLASGEHVQILKANSRRTQQVRSRELERLTVVLHLYALPRRCEQTGVVYFLSGAANSVNLIPVLMPALFERVPVEWSRQNARNSKIASGECHNILTGTVFLQVRLLLKPHCKPPFAASVTSPGQ